MIMAMEYWKITISTTTCTLAYKSGRKRNNLKLYMRYICACYISGFQCLCVREDSVPSVPNIYVNCIPTTYPILFMLTQNWKQP